MNRAPAFPKPGPSSCPDAGGGYNETMSSVAANTSPEATSTIVV